MWGGNNSKNMVLGQENNSYAKCIEIYFQGKLYKINFKGSKNCCMLYTNLHLGYQHALFLL